jgi:NADPH:quinone reductase-like Zn-dependent oxidoreductase
MPGRTAYVGIEILKPVVGQTLLVSGAAGAVGSLVLQLGKRKGARVVGIAGSADKCSFLASLGADANVRLCALPMTVPPYKGHCRVRYAASLPGPAVDLLWLWH